MRVTWRQLLTAMLLFAILVFNANLPRIWHAHRGATLDHQHDQPRLVVESAHSLHDDKAHSHSHSHGHSHSHSHGHSHAHPHSHEPVSQQSSQPRRSHLDDTAEEVEQDRWHSHVSIFGWTFTIWGPVADHPSVEIAASKSERQSKNVRSAISGERQNGDQEKQQILARWNIDWIAAWCSTLILFAPPIAVLDLGFFSNGQFTNLEDDLLSVYQRQPPVPPPR